MKNVLTLMLLVFITGVLGSAKAFETTALEGQLELLTPSSVAIFTDLEGGTESLVETSELISESCGEGIYLAERSEDGALEIVEVIRCIFPLLPKEEKGIVCPEIYAPVCGLDEFGFYQTFSNECFMGAENAEFFSQGECQGLPQR